MADTADSHGSPSKEEVAYKLLYLVAWSENKDLDAWGKADRKWILDTYAECLQTVREPGVRKAGQGPVS